MTRAARGPALGVLLPIVAIIAFSFLSPALTSAQQSTRETFATEPKTKSATMAVWGAHALGEIHAGFYMPESKLYAEEIGAGKKPHPSWIWDASIQLGALNAAAKLYPETYLPMVKSYAAALRTYETHNENQVGLDVNPGPKKPDRYYDDNAWISLSLCDTYLLTHDPQDLQLATDAYSFLMSGEDKTDGGIFWHEDQKKSKNACSCGPGMLASLRFYQITGDQKYLDTAKRLYDWTRSHLQDTDGLIFDSMQYPSGKLNKTKFTYNTATIIRTACALYQITKDEAYLKEAERVAKAAEKYWARPSDGIFTGAGKLNVKLVEAFFDLYDVDHNDHWLHVNARCLTALRQHRNTLGWYPQNWEAAPLSDTAPVRLIDQSAPALGYWLGAAYDLKPVQ